MAPPFPGGDITHVILHSSIQMCTFLTVKVVQQRGCKTKNLHPIRPLDCLVTQGPPFGKSLKTRTTSELLLIIQPGGRHHSESLWKIAFELESKWLQRGSFEKFLVQKMLFVQELGLGLLESCAIFQIEKLSSGDCFSG